MPWKILSIISILCLGAACYFAVKNTAALKDERTLAKRADENLTFATKRQQEVADATERSQSKLAQLEKDRDATKEEVVKLAAEAQEREAALALLKQNLDQVTEQVRSVAKQIEDAGDVESLVAQIDGYKKEETDAQGLLANQTQRLAQAEERETFLKAQIDKVRVAEANQRKGIVDSDFTARVSNYYPQWGFAVLDRGNKGGVFAKADLEVKRGSDVIAKLKVRNVEQGTSVADVVPGSLAEGESIRSGDLVVAAAQQSAAKEKEAAANATTAAEGAAADAPASDAPAADAPAMDAGTSDPFGGGGMAPAPAEAPAGDAPAMSSDPFGAAPAPTTPEPAPVSDPFGS